MPFSDCPTAAEALRNLSPYSHKHNQALLRTNIEQKTVSDFLKLNKIFLFHFWVLFDLCIYPDFDGQEDTG